MNRFKDEKSILKLIEDYKEPFERINYFAQLLSDKVILGMPHEMTEAMAELASIFVSLNEITYEAETEHINEEDRLSERKRGDRASKENYTSYEIEVERIALLRRIRNIFRERRESCEKLISVIQSLLRIVDKEKFIA